MHTHINTVGIGVKSLEFLEERQKLFMAPALHVEAVIVDSLASSIHLARISALIDFQENKPYQEIDRGAASENAPRRNDNLPATKMVIRFAFVKNRRSRVGSKVREVHRWVHNGGVIVVVSALLDEENRETRVGTLQTACQRACRSSTCAPSSLQTQFQFWAHGIARAYRQR